MGWLAYLPLVIPALLVWGLLWEHGFRKEGERAAFEFAKAYGKSEALDAQCRPASHCPYSAKTDWRKHSEWCRGFESANIG